jgi:hypothetical protein
MIELVSMFAVVSEPAKTTFFSGLKQFVVAEQAAVLGCVDHCGEYAVARVGAFAGDEFYYVRVHFGE